MSPQSSVPYRTSAGIESAVIMNTSVSATIAVIYVGVAVIVMSYAIVPVYGKVPSA